MPVNKYAATAGTRLYYGEATGSPPAEPATLLAGIKRFFSY